MRGSPFDSSGSPELLAQPASAWLIAD